MAANPSREAKAPTVPALATRVIAGLASIVMFLLVRDSLDPAPLVAARFGLGITLFALIIDLGRGLVGAAPPLQGSADPHRQQAQALVDEDYRRVHDGVEAFIDDGRWTRAYELTLSNAMDARGIPDGQRQQAIEQARQASEATPYAHRPMLMAIVSGLAATAGTAAVLGVLLEALDVAIVWPVVLALGLGVYLIQLRPLRAGRRWPTVALGLTGAALTYIGSAGLAGEHGGAWWLLQVGAGALALASLALAFLASFEPPSWSAVEAALEREMVTLRRAFLVTLVAGLVLFPFKPLLDALFEAVGWDLAVPYSMAVIGYGTLATFLALELASAWYALAQGRAREHQQRRTRIQATHRILELLDQHTTGTPAPTGGPR